MGQIYEVKQSKYWKYSTEEAILNIPEDLKDSLKCEICDF